MIKVLAAARRRPGMTHAEYCDYVEHVHGELSRANPLGLARYVQNHVFDSAYGTDGDQEYTLTAPRDSVTELYFSDVAAMMGTFGSPYAREVIGPDGKNFADEQTTLTMIVSDREIVVPARFEAPIKAMHFLASGPRYLPGSAENWAENWNAIQSANLSPALEQCIGRCVLSLPMSGGPIDTLAAHFGGSGGPAYGGIASYWLRSEADIPLFRKFQKVVEAAGKAEGTVDPKASFVVFAREICVFPL